MKWFKNRMLRILQNKEVKTSEIELFEHKIVISLQKIKLNLEKIVDCILKYEYNLLESHEISSAPGFKVTPEQTEMIPTSGYREYRIPTTVSKDAVRKFMEKNPLEILVYDDAILLGISTINLGRLFIQAKKLNRGAVVDKMVIPIFSDKTDAKAYKT